MLRRGQVVERYEVDAEIGRGGMAVVYRVTHRTLGSVHALKVLYLPSPGLHDRVIQEGRIQASLRHPNVVAVTDVVDVDGSPGLIMDYVDGDHLDRWLEAEPRSLEEILQVFREIVAGVEAAHARGLVHRDLKPGNVLMSQINGRWTPLITDFGLAKALTSSGAPSPTRSNVTMGTPSYMAPEQIRNAKAVDQRADVFSLGALLYRMCVGRQPFGGDDVLAVMQATAEGDFVPPQQARPELPAAVASAIQASLAPDPARRLQSCGELLAALNGKVEASRLWTRGEATRDNLTLAPMDTLMMAEAPPVIAPAPPMTPSHASSAPMPTPSEAPPSASWRGPAGIVAAVALVLALLGAASGLFGSGEDAATGPGSSSASAATGAATGELAAPASVQGSASTASAPTAASAPASAPVGAPVSPSEALSTEPSPTAKPAASTETTSASDAVSAPATTSGASRASTRHSASGGAAERAVEPEATVSVAGDAAEVWLESDSRKISLGKRTAVPPGAWRIWARFPGVDPVSAGRTTLVAGTTTTISCSAAFQRCQARGQP